MYEGYEKDGLVVLAVSTDRKGIEVVKKFVSEKKLTFPNLHDPSGATSMIYRVRGVPTTYVLNREGNVVGMNVGPREWDSDRGHTFVQQLLAEPEPVEEVAENADEKAGEYEGQDEKTAQPSDKELSKAQSETSTSQ